MRRLFGGRRPSEDRVKEMRVMPRLALLLTVVLACAGASAQEAAPDRPAASTTDAIAPAPRDFLGEFRQSLTSVPDPKSLTVRGTLYVPAYHNIRGTHAA